LAQPNQYRREDTYYSFVTRVSKSAFQNPLVVGVGFSSVFFPVAAGFLSIPLAADQALKLVSADGFIFDPTSSGSIVVLSHEISTEGNSQSTNARQYPGNFGGQIIGANGQSVHAQDDEWFFWNDYTEQGGGGMVPDFDVSYGIDFHNTSAAAVNCVIQLTVVAEIYEKQKIGLTGQQHTLRTLREIPE
jgi:hypothetical protein